jgi:hypothetical protein
VSKLIEQERRVIFKMNNSVNFRDARGRSRENFEMRYEIEYRKLEVTFRNLVGEKPDAVGTV